MTPIYHDQLMAVKEFHRNMAEGSLPKEFIVPDNLLIIGAHNYDSPSFFEEQMEFYNCEDYVCLKTEIEPWSNTLRLRPYMKYLESEEAKSKEYVLFVDTDDVFFHKSPHKILDIFLKQFSCDLLFNATRFADGYMNKRRLDWARRTHKDWYLNAGAYIGKKDFVIKVFKRVLAFVNDDDLPAKKWYTNRKKYSCIPGKVFPQGCGSDQVILRHLEHEFYPRLKLDTTKQIFSRIGYVINPKESSYARHYPWRTKARKKFGRVSLGEDNKRHVFLDCGAHMGQSIKKFEKSETCKKKSFEIFSFEPNSKLIENLKKYDATIINAAVWTEEKEMEFYLDRNDWDGSSLLSKKRHPSGVLENDLLNPMTVQAIDFSSWVLCNFLKKDYIILKMDIEGAEYDVLSKMIKDKSLAYVNELYVEWHYKKIDIDFKEHQALVDRVKEICPNVHGEYIKEAEHLECK